MLPLVTIIIPIFNAQTTLEVCLDSILSQTYKNLEVITINDGSTDLSSCICDKYASRDDRIIVIHKKNEGVSAARNDGIEVATGEFITFVDADDFIDKDMINVMVNEAIQNNDDIVMCGYNIIKNQQRSSRHIKEYQCLNSIQGLEELVNNRVFEGYLWNKLYRKESVKEIRLDPRIDICEDFYYNVTCFCHVSKIACIPDVLYNYVINDNGATRKIDNLFDETGMLKYVTTFQKVQEYMNNNKVSISMGKRITDVIIETMLLAYETNKAYVPSLVKQLRASKKELLKSLDKKYKRIIKYLMVISFPYVYCKVHERRG